MNLTLVIPTHNRNHNIALLIESIARQTLDDLKIEVIVVSNLKDEALEKLVKLATLELPYTILYFEVGKIGVNSARNLGIKMAKSKKIYFLDDDVILKNSLQLKTIFEASEKNPQIAAIGGSYTLPEKSKTLDKNYHHISMSWLEEGPFNLVGGNTLYNYALLGNDLHFNEDIIFGGSETELNLRLHLTGYKFLLQNSLSVEHQSHLSYFTLIKKAIRQGMGRSFHEKIVPSSFWKTNKHNNDIFLYNFFFHVGYRHGKKTSNAPFSLKIIFLCVLETFFQIKSDETLNVPNPNEKPFHLQLYPKLKFRELHHWLKANTWWKIPNYFFWKIIPFWGNILFFSIGIFFPFEPLGLRILYYRVFYIIEKTIQGNN